MNLPADPKERQRVTAAVLRQKFGDKTGHGLWHQSAKFDGAKDDEQGAGASGGVKVNEPGRLHKPRYQRRMIKSANSHAIRLVGSILPSSRQPRRWRQNTNQYKRQPKTKQLDGSNVDATGRNENFFNSVIEQQQARASDITSRPANCRNKDAPLCTTEDHDGDLLKEVKKRLSLPSDTPIPDDFLAKLNELLINSVESRQPVHLNRIARRQSLFDIGFGKLSTYTKLHALGAGTYSIVYKGTSRLTNRPVALKEIHLEREEGVPFTAIREVSLLKQLKHNNIITLHDLIHADRTLTLVFEFVDQDLSHYMDLHDHKINLHNARLFLFQLLRALKYCHDRKILHRDIKPQNILISEIGELKLADFGLARARTFPTKTYTDEVVTLWYRPPDILLGNVNYGPDIDMWGVGCIFFEMVAGFTPFLGVDLKKQVGCIFEILGTPSVSEWPDIRQDLRHHAIDIPQFKGRDLGSIASRLDEVGVDLLKGFLRCNPNLRTTSSEALEHEYFSSYFPPEIYKLPDSVSIFSLPEVRLSREEFARSPSSLQNVHV